ncbi:MAG: ribbon-helix-helix domain-containing protein [Desulfurococcales archaeon]|nr:ribbon-helix-helix domain-containing protein [Desulfurococcales archaeon]
MADRERKGKYTTVSIPVTLYERIKKIIEGTGFTSVSQFVTYVLREVVASYEAEQAQEPFTEEERRQILEKLRRLGYL